LSSLQKYPDCTRFSSFRLCYQHIRFWHRYMLINICGWCHRRRNHRGNQARILGIWSLRMEGGPHISLYMFWWCCQRNSYLGSFTAAHRGVNLSCQRELREVWNKLGCIYGGLASQRTSPHLRSSMLGRNIRLWKIAN